MLVGVLVLKATVFFQNLFAAYCLNKSVTANNHLLHKEMLLKGATQQLFNRVAAAGYKNI